MADPATRIVSLTITEGGYLVNQVDRRVRRRPTRRSQPTCAAAPSRAPRSGSSPRRCAGAATAGIEPFTVMSCDNIQGNGEVAHKMIGAFARLKDAELARLDRGARRVPELAWSTGSRRSPPTTTATTLAERFGVEDGWPVVCEPFTQWVLEDGSRPAGRRSRRSACSWCRT